MRNKSFNILLIHIFCSVFVVIVAVAVVVVQLDRVFVFNSSSWNCSSFVSNSIATITVN